MMKKTPKPVLVFNRAATKDDSFKREGRDHAVTVKGRDYDVVTTVDEILEALYIDESDRLEDGGYSFRKNTVTVTFASDSEGRTWDLSIRTTRTPKPVQLGLKYEQIEDSDKLKLVKGYVNHRNEELDNQFVNNPEMHDFALYSAYKEIRREKEPRWWYDHLKAYDKENGTDYADAFWRGLEQDEKTVSPSPHA